MAQGCEAERFVLGVPLTQLYRICSTTPLEVGSASEKLTKSDVANMQIEQRP